MRTSAQTVSRSLFMNKPHRTILVTQNIYAGFVEENEKFMYVFYIYYNVF